MTAPSLLGEFGGHGSSTTAWTNWRISASLRADIAEREQFLLVVRRRGFHRRLPAVQIQDAAITTTCILRLRRGRGALRPARDLRRRRWPPRWRSCRAACSATSASSTSGSTTADCRRWPRRVPDASIVMVGPVVKVEPDELPQRPEHPLAGPAVVRRAAVPGQGFRRVPDAVRAERRDPLYQPDQDAGVHGGGQARCLDRRARTWCATSRPSWTWLNRTRNFLRRSIARGESPTPR